MKTAVCRLLAVTVVVAVLLGPGLKPVQATPFGATSTAIASWTGITVVGATALYLAWVNRPANQPVDWSPKGPGGWYVGPYTGVSFVPTTDWHYGASNTFGGPGIIPYPTTARNIGFGTSPVFGLKLGYFFHKFPYLGLETDAFFTQPGVKDQIVKLSTPFPPNNRIPGNKALFPGQNIWQWTLAFHIIGRLGFIKDDEVPFGRIQPYVGIGPGFTAIYAEQDSAKNFGVDGLIGVRYMIRKNLSVFTEFKFNRQFAVELEHSRLKSLPSGAIRQEATASFDFTMLTWAMGVSVHFW